MEKGFDVLVAGVRKAAADGLKVRVFGPAAELSLVKVEGVTVVDTSESIGNDQDPVPAVRSRPEASIVRAVDDVKQGNSSAVVSLGSTGATMAAATFGLRRSLGVKRPALAAQIPLPGRSVLFLDVGANLDVRAQHLIQFAYLGASFSRSVLGVSNPSVGLLSVGEEAGKGRSDVVEAHAALSDSEEIDFIGNVEGRDIPAAVADVIVTDGFTGNIALKAMEGASRLVGDAITSAARSNLLSALGGLMMKPAMGGLRRELHPDTTGGAILLGLRNVTVVGHGSSGPDGVANAIRLAARAAAVDAPFLTEQMLHRVGANRGAIDSGDPA